jgi:DNA-binding IclR family transcriptional regulator
MLARNKIEHFLASRKTPVTARQMADYFLIHISTVNRALNELIAANKVARTPQRTWQIVRSRPVAVPAVADAPAPVQLASRPAYDRPMLNSYPHARGYDD